MKRTKQTILVLFVSAFSCVAFGSELYVAPDDVAENSGAVVETGPVICSGK